MSACLSACRLFFCLPAFQPVCLSLCVFVYLFVCLSVCLSVCFSVCLLVFLSICLFVCVFVCRSVNLSVSLSEEPHLPKHFVLPRTEIFHDYTKGILFLVMRQKYSPEQVDPSVQIWYKVTQYPPIQLPLEVLTPQ